MNFSWENFCSTLRLKHSNNAIIWLYEACNKYSQRNFPSTLENHEAQRISKVNCLSCPCSAIPVHYAQYSSSLINSMCVCVCVVMQLNELAIGNVTGTLAVFKGVERSKPWKSCNDLGNVSYCYITAPCYFILCILYNTHKCTTSLY